MSSKLAPYPFPPTVRSSLLTDVPAVIPPVDELEQLQNELKLLKHKAVERAKKAGEDLKTIEESMRRMKEKEKGKFKAVDKIKREREYTPSIDGTDSRPANSIHAKPRVTSHPIASLPPSSSRSSLDPRRSAADDLKKKKKKRKREDGESEGEHDVQRPRKTTPPAIHTPTHAHPPKAQKSTVSLSQPHPKPTSGPDFTVPQPTPLLPPRPPIPPPPIPGPSKPTEVAEDFSRAKQPNQILVSTFYTSIEPWLRPVREEDAGFLEYTGDEVEPYVLPRLGRHYTDVWADQDAGLLPAVPLPGTSGDLPAEAFAAPMPTWDPSTLMEVDLVAEERGHGPLTERVISALLPVPDLVEWKGVKAAEDMMEGRPGGSGAAAARRERLNVQDLENRIRDTMRFHGLLEGMPDYTTKVDDPISTALRHAQSELRTVVATNKARKARLASIARDRLGYQEYLELRDSIDKNITALYTKLQKKDLPKLNKKKKKPPTSTEEGAVVPGAPPAALGLNPDEENRLGVNEQLKQLVETRRQWVDVVGRVFEEKQRESPGRIWGLPGESVYAGVEEEVTEALRRGADPGVEEGAGSGSGKGKEREKTGDEMDVG